MCIQFTSVWSMFPCNTVTISYIEAGSGQKFPPRRFRYNFLTCTTLDYDSENI